MTLPTALVLAQSRIESNPAIWDRDVLNNCKWLHAALNIVNLFGGLALCVLLSEFGSYA